MIETIRTIIFLVVVLTGPGVMADLAVRIAQIMRVPVFPLMAPESVPYAVAIYVTQWWVTLICAGFLGALIYLWIPTREDGRPNGP